MRRIEIKGNVPIGIPNKKDNDKLIVNPVGNVYIYTKGGLVYKLHHISEKHVSNKGNWSWIMMNNSFGYSGEESDSIESAISKAIKQGNKVYQVTHDDIFSDYFMHQLEANTK